MSKKETKKLGAYGAQQITVLEGLEPVRKRPGMYIGTTGPAGLHHLVWEVVDNAIDEAMAGFANDIKIKLLPNNKVEVYDNGRGIPVDKHPQYKVSALELVMTKLHAGGKFGAGGYKVSGGLHGVGVSVVNALSSWTRAEVRRDGKVWAQEYKTGKPTAHVKCLGNTRDRGTMIAFQPDATIFETVEFDLKTILDRVRQQSYLTKGVKMSVRDERDSKNKFSYVFFFEGGISSYVKHINHTKKPQHENVFYVSKEIDNINVEVAMQYTDEYKETVFPFANNIHNPEGGTHMIGFRSALTRVLNSYARTKNFLKEKDENLTGDDVREGMTAVISVKVPDPQFEGQTKSKLGNPEVRGAVETVFGDALTTFMEEHPRDAEAILEKCILASRARVAAKAARDTVLRKGVLDGLTLPGKLSDCSSRNPAESEIFIVEGDSAGGCFVGDTKIALVDGRALSFIELIKEQNQGKQNYCYTMTSNGNIAVAPIKNVRQTKQNTSVIKIILDNNEEIICTPDHKFRIADGNYVQAQNLTPKMNLAPLYRQLSRREKWMTIEGYETVYNPAEKRWVYTHVLSDEYNLKQKTCNAIKGGHRHHIDFNKKNNNPDNLTQLSKDEHLALHRTWADKHLRTPEVLEKLKAIRQTPEFKDNIRKKLLAMSDVLSTRAKKQWQNQEYKKFMKQKFLEFYNSNEAYRITNKQKLDQEQTKYWSDEKNCELQAKRVSTYFKKHPEIKKEYSKIAKQQWKEKSLLEWRQQKTKEQWTPEFRAKRKLALDKTHYHKTIALAKEVIEKTGSIWNFDNERIVKKDKSILRLDNFAFRYFGGDPDLMIEAVENYNHKIKKITRLEEKFDVYDLEIPKTHNFALEAGIFVHNSSKMGRNRRTQAILPLRGKVLNVERARLDKMLQNNELKSLLIALGTNIGEQFDIESLRYHKIILMSDADSDGHHITTLLLTLFYRYFPDLITKGHLYIAQPPLYRIQLGKEIRHAYSEEEKEKNILEMTSKKAEKKKEKIAEEEEIIEEVDGETKEGGSYERKVTIQRYKGLGEMNAEQLWETTMNPESRILKQVTIMDVEKADEIFDVLMGSEVGPRKRFIQTHAKTVKNLDI